MITLARILFFVSQIKNTNLSRKFLVSYHATSLVTNISLQTTIDIAVNLVFSHNPNLSISERELKKLFLLAASQIHFIFNSKFYNQIDEIAIGSTLAPVTANMSMGFYESKWLNEYNLNKSKFYLRYVDDILSAFDSEQDSLNFLKLLNFQQKNKSRIPLLFLIYSFQVSIIKISYFKHITNRTILDFS